MTKIKTLLKRYLPENALIHLQALDHYFHGERELRLLKFICSQSTASVDIGANIGIYTYFMRRYSGSVYAYEPNPDLFQRLQKLFPDVAVRHAALSDKAGELVLRIPVEHGKVQHELGSVTDPFNESTEIIQHKVPALALDDEKLKNVGFIKIDVEKNEIPVLNGALNTINASMPKILVEVTPLLYPRSLPDMFSMLTDLGYDGWFEFEKRYISLSQYSPGVHANPDNWNSKFMGTNILFLPPGSEASFLG